MDKNECYEIGYVIKTHGLHGEVLVQLDVDDSEEYDEMESVFIELNNRLIPFFVSSINLQDKGKAIIKFEDVNRIEESQPLKGKTLFLALDCLPELPDGEYYLHDIIGFRIVDKHHGPLGTVTCYHTETGQTLLEMDYLNREVLIPMTDEIVLKPDLVEKILYVNMPNGLLEVYMTDSHKPDDEDEE